MMALAVHGISHGVELVAVEVILCAARHGVDREGAVQIVLDEKDLSRADGRFGVAHRHRLLPTNSRVTARFANWSQAGCRYDLVKRSQRAHRVTGGGLARLVVIPVVFGALAARWRIHALAAILAAASARSLRHDGPVPGTRSAPVSPARSDIRSPVWMASTIMAWSRGTE